MSVCDESGMVTAEYAVALPAILTVFCLAIAGLMHVSAHADACHGARLYAREITVGASPSAARSIAQDGTATDITAHFSRNGALIHVTAQSTHHFPGLPSPTCTVATVMEEGLP